MTGLGNPRGGGWGRGELICIAGAGGNCGGAPVARRHTVWRGATPYGKGRWSGGRLCRTDAEVGRQGAPYRGHAPAYRRVWGRAGGRRSFGGSAPLAAGQYTLAGARIRSGVGCPSRTAGRPIPFTNPAGQSCRGPAQRPTGTRRSRTYTPAPGGQAGRRPLPRRRTPDPSLPGPPHVVPSHGRQDHGCQQGGDGVGGQQGGLRVRVRRYVELGRDGQHRD